MAKAFFMGWPMWEKLTFVLACAIFVIILAATIKLSYNYWRLRKYTALEKEKREQSLQRQMSQRQRAPGVDDVPFGVRAIESGVEVEGVWISRPNTPDSQSVQSSPGSSDLKQHAQISHASDQDKGLTRIETVDLDQHRTDHGRSASDSTIPSATPASAGPEHRTSADAVHHIHATREPSSDAGIAKPPKSRHPPCSYNKYSGTPYVSSHLPTVHNTLEGLEAIHRASTNVNVDGGSGSSESGSGGDDSGPISAAAPALLSNGKSAKQPKHRSADLVMLDTHRISQAAETGQLTPKAKRPGQSRDSSVASMPHSATSPSDYFDHYASRERRSFQKGTEVTSPTNPLSSSKIDALPAAVRRSSMPDVTPFAKFCQTAPLSPTSPKLESSRAASQSSAKTGGPASMQSRYYAAPATPLASNAPTPPPPGQTVQPDGQRMSFERRESQVLRGHGSGFEVLKQGSFPLPTENPLERQKAAPPVSLHTLYGSSRSRSTEPSNRLQKKRRPSADSEASSDGQGNSRNSVL